MFLSPDELQKLTGAKTRPRQIRWLTASRFRFVVNAKGWPVVLKKEVEPKPEKESYGLWEYLPKELANKCCFLRHSQPGIYVVSRHFSRHFPKRGEAYVNCKVGMSDSPRERLASLIYQETLLYTLRLELFCPCTDKRSAEQRAHQLLNKYAIGREWFECSIAVAEQAIKLASRSFA